MAKIGAYVPADRRQTDTTKLHKTINKLLTKQIRIMQYKVSYLRACLERKWNWRSHVASSTFGRNGHCGWPEMQ